MLLLAFSSLTPSGPLTKAEEDQYRPWELASHRTGGSSPSRVYGGADRQLPGNTESMTKSKIIFSSYSKIIKRVGAAFRTKNCNFWWFSVLIIFKPGEH